jgi:hypothetical protein
MSVASRRLITIALTLSALAVAGLATAAATDPQISIDPADQAWAQSIVLVPGDLGQGWTADPVRESEPQSESSSGDSTWCREGIPNQSDLTITGVATSQDFRRSDDASVSSYSIVWQTAEQAQADWDRTMVTMPAVIDCLAGLFNGGPKAVKIVVTAKGAFAFPPVTSRTAAFRIKLAIQTTVRVKKKRKKKLVPFANLDFVMVGNGRASGVMILDSFNPKLLTVAYERSLAEKMAARMTADPRAAPAP